MFAHLAARLEERAAADRPVQVGLVGAGRFGSSVAAQLSRMRGLRLSAVADVRSSNAHAALEAAGWGSTDLLATDSPAIVRDRIHAGKPVVVEDAALLAEAPLDVIVEATGRPDVSARVIPALLGAGIHVINVTVEADVLLGTLFRRQAESAGVVYSLADGDQPICTKRLYDWAVGLGYEVIAAGRGTRRYPADRALTPADAFARYGVDDEQVRRRRLNAQMYNSFVDGSKAQIESTAIANMTGLVPDVRGMHEPSAAISDLPNVLRRREDGGVLGSEGVVELANAVAPDGQSLLPDAIANGVWAVVTTDQPLLREDMAFYHLPVSADGKAAVLSRTYHLCGIETPWSIVEAALGGHPSGAPRPVPVADVVAFAKRDLRAGETLDGSGGASVYGLIERAAEARAQKLLPLGLADGI
ncbi:MAG: flagellar biosynthesis protein FlgA, partial [Dehalococcoidia bacterium]|nr:flagellar biosynthesis protein FlgA [Dehalococcoidia bacterium]